MLNVTFELKSAGYCIASKSHALRGVPKKTIKFYATYALISHPRHGHILFDTGYTTRFYQYTRSFPFSIYAKATRVYVKEKNHAVAQIQSLGIAPEEIRYIIVSHFHADHIGGLRDFPNAKFICSEEAYADIKGKRGFSALKRGFIPELMPESFEQRTQMINIQKSNNEDPHLGKMYDLFDDGSILLYQIEGHAKGQMGALLNTEGHDTLLIADAAWLKENYTQMHLPSPIVRLFFDSWANFKTSLKNVHDFHKAHPDTLIIPCHCEATYREVSKDLTNENG
ncbi:MAG: MBL fold metallo-hydrolase [Marinoscillum sp.]